MPVGKIRVPHRSKKEPLVLNWNLILWLPGLLPSLKKKKSLLICLFCFVYLLFNSFGNNYAPSRLIVTCASQWEECFFCHLCLSLRGRVASGSLITTEKACQCGVEFVETLHMWSLKCYPNTAIENFCGLSMF